MKRTIFLITLLLVGFGTFSQHLPYNNQLIFNKFSIVPATAGLSGSSEVFTTFRQQWLGIKGAPKQEAFYLFTPVSANMGAGVSLLAEQTGNFSSVYLSPTYAYHIPFSDNAFMSFALSPFFARHQLDFSKIQSFGSGIDPALQNTNLLVVNSFDIGISMNFFYNGLNFGINVPKTLGLKFPYSNTDLTHKTEREYFALLSYKIRSGNFYLEPELLVRTDESWQPDYGLDFSLLYKNYWISTGFRSDMSLLFGFGTTTNSNILISYSYELGLSGISAASNGTHEVSLGFLIGTRKPFRYLASMFKPKNSEQEDKLAKRLDEIEHRLDAEENMRIAKDNDLQEQIDQLKKGKITPSPEPHPETPEEPVWTDTIVSTSISFGYLKAEVFSSSFAELDKYVLWLKKDMNLKIKIVVLSSEYMYAGKELAEKRAKAVAEYIISKGIDPKRVFHEGGLTSDAGLEDYKVEILFNKKVTE